MNYEEKKRSIRSIRSQMKKAVYELKNALINGYDTAEIEEELLRLAKSKYEISQRVRFRSY
ncbi:MAG: hypothetical protein QW701_01015 [Candidatus Nezhaarchaeales archaeon]